MHARYVARYLTPPQHLTCAVVTVGHFVRRVGSRLQRSVGEEDDTGHSAGVKKEANHVNAQHSNTCCEHNIFQPILFSSCKGRKPNDSI